MQRADWFTQEHNKDKTSKSRLQEEGSSPSR